jgi:hypothetical protein
MSQPNPEYIKSTVETSVRRLLDEDEVLFRRGASEWTVAHRLAVYLEEISEDFPEWVVDCEFNRQPFDEEGSEFVVDQTKKVGGDTRRPDIIVHKRADPEAEFEGENLLAIELKVNKKREDDVDDIKEIKEEKGYEFGVFIDFYDHPTKLQDWDSSYLEWRPEKLNE